MDRALKAESIFSQSPASGDSGEIAIYNSAFAQNANLSRILAHEFAHEVYRQFSDVEKDQYRIAADWLLIKNPRAEGGYQLIPNRDNEAYVEKDGMESMTEDFSIMLNIFCLIPNT